MEGPVPAPTADGTHFPFASNLNNRPRDTIANMVILAVGAGGRIALSNSGQGSVQLLADVSGYYRSGDAILPGTLTAVQPIHLLDTTRWFGAQQRQLAAGEALQPTASPLPVPFAR
jgi:hypothetical protein